MLSLSWTIVSPLLTPEIIIAASAGHPLTPNTCTTLKFCRHCHRSWLAKKPPTPHWCEVATPRHFSPILHREVALNSSTAPWIQFPDTLYNFFVIYFFLLKRHLIQKLDTCVLSATLLLLKWPKVLTSCIPVDVLFNVQFSKFRITLNFAAHV